ncbi:MAG: SIMPL domain-containing protein [Terriglobales bacterium]
MTRPAAQFSAILFITLALFGTAAYAQQPPAVMAQPNTIYVSADGRYECAPDTALVQFNISAQEETAKAAYERASRASEQIRQILRDNGIGPKSAEIGFFSLSPVYDWRSPKRRLAGYRVNSSVTLKLKDFSKISPIVQQLADMDVTENQNISYTLENMDAAKVKAVEDAYQRARSEAEAVARAGGRTVTELYYSSVDTFQAVPLITTMRPQMSRAAGAPAEAMMAPPTAEFTPQKIVVTARVSTMFLMK